MSEKTLAFVYARSDSQRLPGKALRSINGMALIDLVCERARRLPVDECVLLTTDREVDDELAAHVSARGVRVFRGDALDVVSRTVQAIHALQPDWCIRVNGDCPLFDPALAEAAFNQRDASTELVSNLFTRHFPYGVAVEWFRASLYCSFADQAAPAEREHVTQHLYRLRHRMNVLSVDNERDDSHLRLTVDTPDDYERMAALAKTADLMSTTYWQLFKLPEPSVLYSRVQARPDTEVRT